MHHQQGCTADRDNEELAIQHDLSNYQLTRDREKRVIKPPKRYGHADIICYALSVAEEIQNSEPKTWREAIESEDSQLWLQAMSEEMESLRKNKTWILVDQPKKQKVVGCKWIFKKKEGIPGVERPRFKARLVAKGFTQVEGIDYNEIWRKKGIKRNKIVPHTPQEKGWAEKIK